MKRSSFGFLTLGLLAVPLFAILAVPVPASRAPDLRVLVSQPRIYEMQIGEVKEKRPWLNPARATLRI